MAIKTIIIDNGHGKETPGKHSPVWTDGSQLLEWKYTRTIALKVYWRLKNRGVKVVSLVPEDKDVSLKERCRRANDLAKQEGINNCLLVSIHCNASGDGKARGWEVHTSKGQTKSDEYATIFWHEAKKVLEGISPMRGDWSDGEPDWDSNFTILKDTICPAVLTENLFMDNKQDCNFLLSKEGEQAIVDIHVNAILNSMRL